MSHLRRLIAALGALAFFAASGSTSAQEIQWRTDYNAAWREACQCSRPLFVDVGSEACIWCRRLEESVFREPDVIRLLNEKFVPVKLDGNQNPKFVQSLGIRAYPTMVFGTSDGKVLGITEGYVDASEFRNKCAAALAQMPEILTSSSTKVCPIREIDSALITKMGLLLAYRINPEKARDVIKGLRDRDVTLASRSLAKILSGSADIKTTVIADNP